MEPETHSYEWQQDLYDTWIIVGIVALIVLILLWRPFHTDPEPVARPELRGADWNLILDEIRARRTQEGAGRLYPPRGFGGLAPHQVSTGTVTPAAAGVTTPADTTAPADAAAPAASD